jgi:cytochrome c1
LQYLADFGHELMLLQVFAAEDRTPPWTGELELRDAETGAALKLDFDDGARARYTSAFDEYCSVVESMALRSGGRYARMDTTRPLEDVIFGDLVRMRGIA